MFNWWEILKNVKDSSKQCGSEHSQSATLLQFKKLFLTDVTDDALKSQAGIYFSVFLSLTRQQSYQSC